jgi:single-strand DNA-binding protein
MSGVNKVILIGRLGKDPDIRYTTTGKSMTTFSLATSERWGNEEKTEWHKIVMFDRVAETAHQYLRKGDQVYLEGKIQYRVWEDQKGVKHNTTDIVCTVMCLLGSPRRESSSSHSADGPPPEGPPKTYQIPEKREEKTPAPESKPKEKEVEDDDGLPTDDDMPF